MVQTSTAALDLARYAQHLESLLERQPACLLRAGRDGTLLACNVAALGLLGGRELTEVLGTSLVERIRTATASGAIAWQDLLDRLDAGAATLECDLTDASGTTRAVTLQAVVLDHPDGVPSVLVVARDISAARTLERSLREQEAQRQQLQEQRQQLQDQLAELTRERDDLAATLAQIRALIGGRG